MERMDIPHPKYPLTRYSTSQLLTWLDVAALAECIEAWNEENGLWVWRKTRARILRWEIEDVLREREALTFSEIYLRFEAMIQDVQA